MSSTKPAEEKSINDLLQKTNHPLLDVRCRSLRSVVFKLTNGLLSCSELAREHDFLAHLLEWFNFEEWALESQVLNLLNQLSEHEAAANALVEIGGVEFLSQLRLHCDPSLHPIIDEILEHLLKLPRLLFPSGHGHAPSTTTPVTSAATSAVASNLGDSVEKSVTRHSTTFMSDYTSDMGSYASRQCDPNPSTTASSHLSSLPLQTASPNVPPSTGSESTTSVPVRQQLSGSSSSSEVVSSWTSLVPEGSGQEVGRAGINFPYSVSSVIPQAPRRWGSGEESGGGELRSHSETDLSVGQFPWLRLTNNDHHILTTTQSRLENPSLESVVRSCEFLQDVLFQDFPAELFLQRPVLINRLLQLLVSGDVGPTHFPCLVCLLTFARKLKLRVKIRDSPSSIITNHPNLMTGSYLSHDQVPHPPTARAGAGQQDGLEYLSADMLHQLQANQLSVRHFCSTLTTFTTPLLLAYLDRDFPWMKGVNEQGASPPRSVAMHVHVCLQLLECAVELMEHEAAVVTVPGCKGQQDQSLLRPLQHCITSLCSLISQCQSKWRRMSSQDPSPHMQLVCCLTLDLGHYLSRLLRLSGRGWKEEGCEECTVPSLVGVLQGFMMGVVVGVVCPHLQTSLLKVFAQVDPPGNRLFSKVKMFSDSFQWMALFLSCTEATPTAPPPGVQELVEQATRGLPGLWFYSEERFIAKAAHLCLESLSTHGGTEEEGRGSKQLLMKLLCHGDQKTQQTAYKHFTEYLRNSLPSCSGPLNSSLLEPPTLPPGVGGAADVEEDLVPPTLPLARVVPTSSPLLSPAQRRCGTEHVLLDRDIIRLVATQGAVSRSDSVSLNSLQLLADLLAMREELIWPELKQILSPLLPYIEVCVVEQERLFEELKEVLCSPGADVCVCPLTQLHSLLRLLYSDSAQVRQWSYGCLTEVLARGGVGERWSLPSPGSLPYQDVLVMGKALKEGVPSRRSGAFKQEDALKLVSIVQSDTINLSLKKSALEQLVILLRDDCLHARALEEGLLDQLTSTLTSILLQLQQHTPKQEPGREQAESGGDCELVDMLRPCVNCLLVLATFSRDVRSTLNAQQQFLTSLLKVAVLRLTDVECLSVVSKLLALLVFAEEVRVSEDGGVLLPNPLKDRLKLPFEVGGYDLECDHLTPSPLEPSILTSEPLLSVLRMQCLCRLSKNIVENGNDCDGLDQTLQVPDSDFASLKSLNLRQSLAEYFNLLTSASSHSKVTETLHHVSVVMHTVHCVGGEGRRGLSYPDAIGSLWISVAERFMEVSPSTAQDHTLLEAVLSFLSDLLSLPSNADSAMSPKPVGREELSWLCGVSMCTDSVLIQLLQSSLQQGGDSPDQQSKRSLQKVILQYFSALLNRLASEGRVVDFDLSPLLVTLSQCLDIAGSPVYYDIPLLELSLDCLLLFTDRKLFGGVSSRSVLGLSMKLMSLLRQVLWSFMSGQGKMVESFMGKGVISRGSLAMSHLMLTIETQLHPPQEWWLQWLQCSDTDLTWLQLLVEDREPSVRYAGLSLLSSLCCKPGPSEVLLTAWAPLHPLSLWGVCVKVALETRECSLIRKQAVLVLAGLSAVCSRESKWDQYLTCTSQQMHVTGEGALAVLLDAYKFLDTLQYSIKSESLAQISNQVQVLLRKVVLDKQALQVFVPVSQYTSTQSPLRDGSGARLKKKEEEPVASTDSQARDELKGLLCDLYMSCDPHVVSSMCQFLYNLFLAFPDLMAKKCHHSATLVQLTSLLDPVVTGAFLLAGSEGIISQFLEHSWTAMVSKILTLLSLVLSLKPDSVLPYVLRDKMVEGLCRTLAQCYLMTSSTFTTALPSALTSLLLTLVGVAPSLVGRELVYSCLQLHWQSFTGLLLLSLESRPSPPPAATLHLRSSCLKLLSSLLLHRFRPPHLTREREGGKRGVSECLEQDPAQAALAKALEHLLDGDSSLVEYKVSECCGAVLSSALVKARGCTLQVTTERWRLVNDTLGILLACSSSAKQAALDDGLLVSSVEHLKSLHTKLCAEGLKQPARRRKESSTVHEIVTVVDLLRNFMYKSELAKTACLKGCLTAVLHKLWPSCTVNRHLLWAVLNLLTTYTAHNPPGRVSMAFSCKGTPCLLQDVLKLTSHTLSCHRSCTSAKMASPHAETLGLLFTLLANTALSQECRAIIKKSNFIAGFSQVLPKQEKALTGSGSVGHVERLSSLWVRLLVNLSFFVEGQTAIIKIPGMLDVLLDICECGDRDSQTLCLLILRNLAFHAHSRTILTNNRGVLDVLLAGLDCTTDTLRVTIAVSALWSLLHNNSKARNSLKKTVLCEKLQQMSLAKHLQSAPVLELGVAGKAAFLNREQCVELSQEACSHVVKLLQ